MKPYTTTRFNEFLSVHSGSFQNLISALEGLRGGLDFCFAMQVMMVAMIKEFCHYLLESVRFVKVI